jgi:hypothetical protein
MPGQDAGRLYKKQRDDMPPDGVGHEAGGLKYERLNSKELFDRS